MSFGFVGLSNAVANEPIISGTLNIDTSNNLVYWIGSANIYRYNISTNGFNRFTRSNIGSTSTAVFNPVDGFLYLTTTVGGSEFIINKLSSTDVVNNTSTASINISGLLDNNGNALGPVKGLALSADGTMLYASVFNGPLISSDIAMFNLPGLTFVKAVKNTTNDLQRLFGFDTLNGRVYGYSIGATNQIYSFDSSSLLLTNTTLLNPNKNPRGIFDSTNNKVYVHQQTDNVLSLYRLSGGTIIQEDVQTLSAYNRPSAQPYSQAVYGVAKNAYFGVQNLSTLKQGVIKLNIPGLSFSNFIEDGGTGVATATTSGDIIIDIPNLAVYVMRVSQDGNLRIAKYSIDPPPFVPGSGNLLKRIPPMQDWMLVQQYL